MVEYDEKDNDFQHFNGCFSSFGKWDFLNEFGDSEDSHEFQQTQELKESESRYWIEWNWGE